uniref:Cellular communication network factor 5 n=1 Tax=Lynx canadensis TaxID=61383 RepID=A0A667FPS3_LYNCA
MRVTLQTHLLAFSLLCLLSKVCAQLCPTPCVCPWPPPRCPPGAPLVLDGCNCCRVCARRLGEPCDHLHVCDPSQGLICQPRAGPGGRGAVCLWGEDDGSCEVNGRVYRDGETFQPHCRVRCHCEDGGFTCVPLCSEDVRLPSWDCPYPRRVEVPGKCCPEWVCDQGGGLGVQPLPAQGECRVGPGPGQGHLGAGRGRGFSGARTVDWSKPGAGPPGGGGGGRGEGGASPEPGDWTGQSPGFPDRTREGVRAEETR